MQELQSQTLLAGSSCEEEWKRFVNVNAAQMFQLALILSGGVQLAENAVIASVEYLDVAMLPEEGGLALWQEVIAMRIVSAADWLPLAGPLALSMLQPALRPVMRIAGRSRICFVLRILLGYSIERCAWMLNIGESETLALLSQAVKQLQNVQSSE